MSYILEALRKAEAERHSGAVPNIHAPPAFAAATPPPPAWRKPWLWFALPACALGAAAAVWFSAASSAPPVTSAAPPIAATAAAPPQALPEQDQEEAAPVKAPAKKKEKPPKKAAVKKSAPPADEPKPAAGSAIATLHELPQHIQRELPALAVGGYIYSGNKAERSVLINKRLLREGDEVAPGLRLETMTPSGMVLSYKGYRYSRSYH